MTHPFVDWIRTPGDTSLGVVCEDGYCSEPVATESALAARWLRVWPPCSQRLADENGQEPGMVDDEPILDPPLIAQLRALDDDDMPNISTEIAQAFLSKTPEDYARLQVAVVQADPKNVGLLGHKIKGSAMNFGGARVARLAEAIELAGKAGETEPSEVGPLGEALDEMYAALRSEFGI